MGNAKTGAVVALGGNPNVGKSTVFNALTGLRQHTGNWPGKTVAMARGYCARGPDGYILVDLPGCYSLTSRSAEEETARDFILSGAADAVIAVCDATCMERSLSFVLQAIELTRNVVVCVNLMDEAEKKGIRIDIEGLSERLGVPVAGTSARSGKGLGELLGAVKSVVENPRPLNNGLEARGSAAAMRMAEEIFRDTVIIENKNHRGVDAKIDGILAGRWTAFPIMLAALLGIFWLTITGANYPSDILSAVLFRAEGPLLALLAWVPDFPRDMLVFGVYRVLAWVVSVMLPPMAIFFPLFTLLEDAGFLPRVAFNLDKIFRKCGACGKQALTMCMGFGCNAAGVIGCRIIDSPRERLIAVITNNFVPCNGRFPTLTALISMFFIGASGGIGASALSAALLTGVIILGVLASFLTSKLLSLTLLRGVSSSFTLELPPYRRPRIGHVLVRSVFDRILFVLGRAVSVAAPAGLVIWLAANISAGGMTLLARGSGFLDPFARLIGMDGVILIAFILGFPANEIVLPIIVMAYAAQGSISEMESLRSLRLLLIENGWTWVTAVSVMLFSLMHWPCSTACLTIKKETRSLKWTLVSILLPTAVGIAVCFVFASAARR